MAKDWAGWVGAMVGVIGLGFAAQQYFFGTFAPTNINEIRGGRSCGGFLINDELPADSKPTTLDEDETKRLKEKIECYRDQIEKNPKDAIAFTNRGEAKRRLGRLREALLDQEKALQLNRDLQEAKIGLGLVEGNLGNTKAANRVIQDAVAQKESAIAYFYQGFAFTQQQAWKSAEASFRRAINLNPNYADAYNNLGASLSKQGKAVEAVSAYQKAINLNPSYADAYNNLGVALFEQGKTAEAIIAYQKAISFNPKYATAYNNLGAVLGEQGKTVEAITAYQKAISLDPNYSNAYTNLGNVLAEQGKAVEAITAHQKAISLNPNNAGAYNNLGNVLAEQGKMGEAIAALRKAISLNPNDADAYGNLGIALKKQGNLEGSISKLKKARDLYRAQGNTQKANQITQVLEKVDTR